MIGIVIVSHSAGLAEGVLELAREMAGAEVKLAAAGGLDLPGQPLGTDPMRVLQAIEAVYSDDGVLVLMDLGSALLSTEMALEMLAPEQRAHVSLCDAPLVEGAVSAAVQARLGASMAQVMAEARGALAAKAEHLGPGPQAAVEPPSTLDAGAATLELTMSNRLGLHARPAARLVRTVGGFPGTRVTVRNLTTGRGPVEARSINGVATLGAAFGHRIELRAEGPRASEVLAALQALAEASFGDPETQAGEPSPGPAAPGPELPPGAIAGRPGASGIGLGPARHFQPRKPVIPRHACADPEREWAALGQAIEVTRAQIQRTLEQVARRSGAQASAIFEAHLLFLEDAELLEPARRLIFEDRLNGAMAWDRAIETMAGSYRSLGDETLRARAMDVLDVGDQVILNLLGQGRQAPVMAGAGILVAPDLSPAETAGLDPSKVLGICTALGGPTSHSAILARTFGIPALVGLGEGILDLPEGCCLIVDAENGWLIPDPDEPTRLDYARRAEAMGRDAERLRLDSAAKAVTTDGRSVAIGANVGSLAQALAAVASGAEGVGLLRTEFLYLDRTTAPDEEEQFQAYQGIAAAMGGRPVIIRTLDIGGDKPLPYIDQGYEANPYLGSRALRLCLARPELFKVQLRAILRVAAAHPVKVMFPMVATLGELRAARALVAEARAELEQRGQPVPDRLELGIMVEIPAAALLADVLAPEVDFFSIGTNDLTQYTLAAERGNPAVAALGDALHPAVLQLIQRVAEAAHRHGKWVGVCGELGGDPLAAAILLGLGIDELSMSAPAIPKIKALIRRLDAAGAERLARSVLGLAMAGEVRAAVRTELLAQGLVV